MEHLSQFFQLGKVKHRPLLLTKIVPSIDVQDENDPNAMKGLAVVQAESMEAAVEIAQSDPFLDVDGTIRVSQMMEMK